MGWFKVGWVTDLISAHVIHGHSTDHVAVLKIDCVHKAARAPSIASAMMLSHVVHVYRLSSKRRLGVYYLLWPFGSGQKLKFRSNPEF